MEYKMKPFKGKAIYHPSGKAREYAEWACNFYVGCSNGCTYCYCKKGILAHAMGGNTPKLKKSFKDESHALDVFNKEFKANLTELQKHGLFFSFTIDPMLTETIDLSIMAVSICIAYDIPVKILTKKVGEWVDNFVELSKRKISINNQGAKTKGLIAFGFTLTGHDELEPNASTNSERIEAMRKLHDAGFKTWASIEPVIDFESSIKMIDKCFGICDLFKIGLLSGGSYNVVNTRKFVHGVLYASEKSGAKIYFKDSLLKQAVIYRDDLPSNCVGRDYNLFKNE